MTITPYDVLKANTNSPEWVAWRADRDTKAWPTDPEERKVRMRMRINAVESDLRAMEAAPSTPAIRAAVKRLRADVETSKRWLEE
jgi:hypothetical protein